MKHRTLIVSAAALLIAVAGGLLLLAPRSSESTDDAYIAADGTSVAPRVRGLVEEVMVQDNQAVRTGDPLVRIDGEEFAARVASAQADVADADAGILAARAALLSLDAEQQLALANVRAAETSIRSALAQRARAVADQQRFEALVGTGAVSRREAESVGAGAVTAEQDAARSSADLDVARSQARVTAARRASLLAALTQSEASAARSRATLDLALQDQRHALIRAPIDGVVGSRQVQRGDYVQPGSRLMTLMPLHAVYVTANFKETQTGHMRPGLAVRIRVDALPGVDLTGRVDSLAPGSGSQFALLPFEPGTGNFTKIVQRVPVRIRFDPGQSALQRLRPGLSVTTRVVL